MNRLILIALASTALYAQTDFNGTWVMNKSKSDFGAMPEQMVPEKLTMKITSSETALKTVSTQVGARGEGTAEANYVLDGKTANTNPAMGGEVKTIAKWEGKDIAMNSSREVQGMTLQIEQRLAKTGADILLMTTKIAGTPMGDIVMKYHLDRAAGPAGPAGPAAEAPAAPPATPVGEAKMAAPVNFAGSWKMNKAKSNFGQLPEEYQPTAATRVVTHDDKVASIKSTQSGPSGELAAELKLKLDGSESVNSMQGAEVKSVAKWDGAAIVVASKREMQGMALEISEKWVKVNDTTMNVETKIGGTPLGDLIMVYVFEKE